jgi:tetratricopeptide (TPR) repeat protein
MGRQSRDGARRITHALVSILSGAILVISFLGPPRRNDIAKTILIVTLVLLGSYIAWVQFSSGHTSEEPGESTRRRSTAKGRTRESAGWRTANFVLGAIPSAFARWRYARLVDRESWRRPDDLPPRSALFRGREAELEHLVKEHNERRQQREAAQSMHATSGPMMIFIHGPLGVGKSDLALELAHRLKDQYSDGNLFAPMGQVTTRRAEREILRKFLGQIGLPAQEMGDADAAPLGEKFRGITSQWHLVVLLDGAKDLAQVGAVIPNGASSTVIVTSRANFGVPAETSLALKGPSPSEGAAILGAYAGNQQDRNSQASQSNAELIAELVELCGARPLALRAIGMRARSSSSGLAEAVRRLQGSGDRLKEIAYEGYDFGAEVERAYRALEEPEKVALQELSLIDSSTFVPWVLQPLMEVDLLDAANLTAGLSDAGLLDELDDDPSGFARYQLNPLICGFAQQEQRRMASIRGSDAGASAATESKGKLARAFLELSAQTMAEVDADPGLKRSVAKGILPDVPNWEKRVMVHSQFWVRAEFRNLLRAVAIAHRDGANVVSWKLADYLSGCDFPYLFDGEAEIAFQGARRSARSSGVSAVARVMAAEGSCLLSAEQYVRAFRTLEMAAKRCSRCSGLNAIAWRKLGQGRQRLGFYREAMANFEVALGFATDCSGDSQRLDVERLESDDEAKIIRLLMAENRALTDPGFWDKPLPDGLETLSPSRRYIEGLVRARHACRLGDVDASELALDRAKAAIDNESRLALALYSTRLELTLAKAVLSPDEERDLIATAARLIVVSQRVRAPVTEAEARIALARAQLRSSGSREFGGTFKSWQPNALQAQAPRLVAAVERVRGDGLLSEGTHLDAAEQAMRSAVSKFGQIGEYWSQADAQLRLGQIQLARRKYLPAQGNFLMAADTFSQCGDFRSRLKALRLLRRPSVAMPLRIIRAARERENDP